MRYSAINPMTLFANSQRVQTDVGRCNRCEFEFNRTAGGVSHLPQLGRCGLCGRVDSPPQGEPIRATGRRSLFPGSSGGKIPVPSSRVDGVLIDQVASRDRRYLS
jgi:hypothetical protein